MNIRKNSGHAAFYTFVIIPFTLILTYSYINISTWNSMRDALQSESARLAADLARMPSTAEVAAEFSALAGNKITTKYPRLTNVSVQASFAQQIATVTIEAKLIPALNFRSFESSFQISKSTSAQLVPGDYTVIMSDGQSLRPPMVLDNTKWPSWDVNYFPAAHTFSYKSSPQGTNNDALWKDLWKNPSYQNWSTQACFNPAFSPLKFAAISLVNAISSLPTNRLEVIFTPGASNSAPYETIRAINESDDIPFGFTKGHIVSNFSYFNDPLLPGAYLCALFSSPEHDLPGNYSLADSFIESDYLNTDAATNGNPFNIVASPFKESFSLNIYQAIYWDVAKRNLPMTEGTPNIVAALESAINSITSAIRKTDSVIRGSLALVPNRQIYIFSDNLTNLSQFLSDERIEYLKVNKLFINITAWKHQYLSNKDREIMEGEIYKIAQLTKKANISLFVTSSPEELAHKIVPLLITKTRNVSFRDYE